MGEFTVGELVSCKRSYPFAAQLGVHEKIGIVFEARRDHSRVFYDLLEQNFWLPNEYLRKFPSENQAELGIAQKLSEILGPLNASEAEFEILEPRKYKLSAHIPGINYHVIEMIIELLGADLLALAIYPEGMARIVLEIEFKD